MSCKFLSAPKGLQLRRMARRVYTPVFCPAQLIEFPSHPTQGFAHTKMRIELLDHLQIQANGMDPDALNKRRLEVFYSEMNPLEIVVSW